MESDRSSIVSPLTRRKALAAAMTGVGVAVVGAASVRAQGATPVATPVTTDNEAAFLFVQAAFSAGSFEPNDDGTYQLTLGSAPEQTIYFSDRPARIVGAMPTERFLAVLGFEPSDPPNAALVIEVDAENTDVIVLELLDPVYDPAVATLTYTVTVLEGFEQLESTSIGFVEQPLNEDSLPAQFGPCSLFIDSLLGCSPWDPRC